MIRPAIPADAPKIATLWNQIIRDTTATFTTVEKDPGAIADQIAKGTPWWVAVENNALQGHVTYGSFRNGPGYARTAEHSIHLYNHAQGKGLGRALIQAMETHAAANGIHVMIAGVSSDNPAGQAFHAAMGYATVGHLPQVGQKWGRWLDLILMQKILT